MKFDFPTLIGALGEEERIRFYETLAHNLTVSVRAIWSDEQLTDGERVERMKWINEMRRIKRTRLLRYSPILLLRDP